MFISLWIGNNKFCNKATPMHLTLHSPCFTVKYKHPAVFFSQNPRLNQLMTALENLPQHALEVPEACNIHPTPEVRLPCCLYSDCLIK